MQKRLLTSLLIVAMSFFIMITGSTSLLANDDWDTGSSTVGGVPVGYTNYLTYMDVECGMNTQSHYVGSAGNMGVTNIDRIGVEWEVVGYGGNILQHNGLHYSNASEVFDNSDPYLLIDRSIATFTFENNGNSWLPGSYAYHCLDWSSSNNPEESDQLGMPDNARNILQKTNDEKKVFALDILGNHYKKEIANYTYKNGNNVSIEDFIMTNSYFESGQEITVNDITFARKDPDSEFSVIYLNIPENVYKNGDEYELNSYVVVIEGEKESIEFGLTANKKEK